MAKFRQPPQSAAEATIVSKTIAANGTYHASADNADGYDPVVVEVPEEHATIVSKNITANGTYDASQDSADGYNPVTVAVPEKVIVSKNITANGTYNASQYSADGFDPVTVAVPEKVIVSKSITANGTYNAAADSADGYNPVVVAVPGATLGTKSITANGTYNASSDNLDGYSQVTVNIAATETRLWTNNAPTSAFAGQDVTLSEDMDNFDYLKFTYRVSTADSTAVSILVSISDIKTSTSSSNSKTWLASMASSIGYGRRLWYVSNTSIHVDTAYILNNVGSDTNVVIPTSIVGCKFA